ncbi:hypothetical protein [Romboutsia hominis]|uniref:Uncharacterized protein n=1 Tax=Romboutsia hominis TaxID=1507512 RepID=A0A2P2BQE8_9FIRM|nr:hypothetical protein [Romboutsia hominis]CEI72569.1 Hypothetical protein FRIFI_1029 [Romboutsia hominis]
MKIKLNIGSLAIILGVLILSLELYGLKFIQLMELQFTGSCPTNSFNYINTELGIAIVLPILIIGYGIMLIVKKDIGE